MAKTTIGKQPGQKHFTFKYLKSSGFKTMQIDGIIGGPTVKRHISMNFYVDTIDIPNTQSHSIVNGNQLGVLIPNVKESATAVREVAFGAIFDIATAKSMVVWLNQKIKEIEDLNASLVKNI